MNRSLTLMLLVWALHGCGSEGVSPICGDGRLDPGEECDDGNTLSGDGCDASCRMELGSPSCGNGIVEADEECDDANEFEGDGCEPDCRFSCRTDTDCDDGDACNGLERCDPFQNRCVASAPLDDGSRCREGEGVCVEGRCQEQCALPSDCESSNPCAGSPSCVSGGCVFENELDGSFCPLGEDPSSLEGVCVDGACIQSTCGDGFCGPTESAESCAEDCGECGDGICTSGAGETADSCPSDCPAVCGDGLCSHDEDGESCYGDCGECGDASCDAPEDHTNCPMDCPPPRTCTATYALMPELRIVGTPNTIYDGTIALPAGTLVLRYESSDDDEFLENGRAEILYFWIRYEFERSTSASVTIPWIQYETNLYAMSCGAPPGTEPTNPPPAFCEDDGNEQPLASGIYQGGKLRWETCDAHPNFRAISLPNYSPDDHSDGPGCLSGLRLRGTARCQHAAINNCNPQIMDTYVGDNEVDQSWTQPLHDMEIEPSAESVSLQETHVPTYWWARAFLSFSGALVTRTCDG